MMQNDTPPAAAPAAWQTVEVPRADLDAWCERAEVPAPPEGTGLAPRILRTGEHVFASWQPETPPYDFAELMAEAWRAAQDGDWLLGIDGHGIQSWALHWMQRRGPLLLGLQVRIGGAFAPSELDRAAVEGAWGLVRRFDAALARAATAGRLPAGKVLVVIDTDLGAGRYAWLGASEAWDQAAWQEDAMAGFAALMELEELAAPAAADRGAGA